MWTECGTIRANVSPEPIVSIRAQCILISGTRPVLFTVISDEFNLVLPWGHGINPVNREITVRHGSRAVYLADDTIEKQVAFTIRDQHMDGNGVVKDIWDAHANIPSTTSSPGPPVLW